MVAKLEMAQITTPLNMDLPETPTHNGSSSKQYTALERPMSECVNLNTLRMRTSTCILVYMWENKIDIAPLKDWFSFGECTCTCLQLYI